MAKSLVTITKPDKSHQDSTQGLTGYREIRSCLVHSNQAFPGSPDLLYQIDKLIDNRVRLACAHQPDIGTGRDTSGFEGIIDERR